MKRLSEEIIQFFQEQGFVIVSTIDKDGSVHNACKGIVDIDKSGKIYLLDLYMGRTLENLKRNPRASITVADEHQFKGYCLKGKAKRIQLENLGSEMLKKWEDRITSRLTQRVIRNIREGKSQKKHPEIFLPKPEYLIVIEVSEIVDLTPGHLK